MKVLMVHTYYQQHSGEAFVYAAERDALRAAGVEVVEFTRDNAEIQSYSLRQKLTLPARTIWAWDAQRELTALIERERPLLAYFVNTLPLISPAAYITCQRAGVAVVQSLQNYRLACPAATFVRDGRICEECPRHGLTRSIRYACYRESRPATATVAAMLAVHRALGTFRRAVDTYVAPTQFVRDKLIQTARLPAERVLLKPNFVHPDPGVARERQDYALFMGRLTPEKGVMTLLEAFATLPEIPLRVVGGGPLESELKRRVNERSLRNVTLLGPLPREEVMALLRRARLLVFPSEWYEGQPLTLLEAFACGTPVISSDVGAMTEVVQHGETGLLFKAGNIESLRQTVASSYADPHLLDRLSAAGRALYEREYTVARNQQRLLAICRSTLERRAIHDRTTAP